MASFSAAFAAVLDEVDLDPNHISWVVPGEWSATRSNLQFVGTVLSIFRDFDCLLRGAMRIDATIRQQMRLAQMLR